MALSGLKGVVRGYCYGFQLVREVGVGVIRAIHGGVGGLVYYVNGSYLLRHVQEASRTVWCYGGSSQGCYSKGFLTSLRLDDANSQRSSQRGQGYSPYFSSSMRRVVVSVVVGRRLYYGRVGSAICLLFRVASVVLFVFLLRVSFQVAYYAGARVPVFLSFLCRFVDVVRSVSVERYRTFQGVSSWDRGVLSSVDLRIFGCLSGFFFYK